MSAPARRRTTRRARRTRLRSWSLGWFLTCVVAAVAIMRTWPLQSAIATVVLAATGLTYALRGQTVRLARHIHRPYPHQRLRAGRATSAAFYAMNPTRFEHAIADLARQDPAVRHATVEGGSNDRAMDVRVTLLNGRRILVQCKRYAPTKPVDANTTYAVNGTYRSHGCTSAAIVTTSRFTASAQAFAAQEGIQLIDGPALAQWANGGPPPWA